MMIGLISILFLVLLLPLINKKVEKNLEVFLLVMGISAATISHVLEHSIIIQSLTDPIMITLAVFVAGLFLRIFQVKLEYTLQLISHYIPFRLLIGFIIFILGLISSVITAIIAALVLVSIVSALPFERKMMVRFVIIACYAIGVGAVLTPLGEPLSTIAINKLDASFFYFVHLIGKEVLLILIALSCLSILFIQPRKHTYQMQEMVKRESLVELFSRVVKVYIFIVALTLLGSGFEPLIETYLLQLSPNILYWANMISAILDNATLAAAEMSPTMTEQSIRSILLGLLISGGMLIPGNIPNIIVANKLHITSSEWARFGFPLGFVIMFLLFLFIQ